MLQTQKNNNQELCMTKILLHPSPLVMDWIHFIHGTNINKVWKAARLIVFWVDILAIFFPNITIQLEAQWRATRSHRIARQYPWMSYFKINASNYTWQWPLVFLKRPIVWQGPIGWRESTIWGSKRNQSTFSYWKIVVT